MARFSGAGRTVTNLPTATAGPGVFGSATGGQWYLREVGIWNTTVTAVCVGIAVCTATGTQAGAVTEYQTDDPTAAAPSEAMFLSQSTASTVAAQIRQGSLGAAIGSGVIWRFDPGQVEIAEGTANGIIINCPTGTAQHLDVYIDWAK